MTMKAEPDVVESNIPPTTEFAGREGMKVEVEVEAIVAVVVVVVLEEPLGKQRDGGQV